MNDEFRDSLESMATDIREQAKELQINTFLSLVYTSDLVIKYLNMELSKYPIGLSGFNMLHLLITNGGSMRPTEISKRLFRSKHTITSIVDTLEKHNLVCRGPGGDDRRAKMVSVTRAGLELIKTTSAVGRERLSHKVLYDLDQEWLEQLSNILGQIRTRVAGLIQEYKKE